MVMREVYELSVGLGKKSDLVSVMHACEIVAAKSPKFTLSGRTVVLNHGPTVRDWYKDAVESAQTDAFMRDRMRGYFRGRVDAMQAYMETVRVNPDQLPVAPPWKVND